MVTTSSTDLGTLGWVKDEIDETLRQARLALEAFVEHRADEAKLRLCATYLHQVAGTLKMVELDTLAMLVGEAEATVESLLRSTGAPSEEVLEPLARTLLLLPEIVDGVQEQGPGDGLAFVSLVNELRAGRGAPPVAARTYFTPDLSPRPQASGARDDKAFIETYRRERSLFQAALLKWLKAPADAPADFTMPDLLGGWRALVAFAPLSQCLWVAEAFLRFVLTEGEARLENKRLASRLDQLLKRFSDGQDKAGSRTACERVTTDMLFVLREGASTDERVLAVRQAFRLTAEEPVSMGGSSVAALQSMVSALSQEIAHAQDLLSRCFDPAKEAATAADDELITTLDKLGKTFRALSIGPLEELVSEAAVTCRALCEGRLEKTGAVAMTMAQALLQIESAVREIPRGGSAWRAGVDERRRMLAGLGDPVGTAGVEVSEAPLSEQDRRQLVGAVGGEVRANLARIEEAFLAFVAAPRDRAALAGIPTLAAQVEAAYRVLGEEGAADLARALYNALNGFASRHLATVGALPEVLAAAVAGLEAHVTGLERGRPMPVSQLSALAAALTDLAGEHAALQDSSIEVREVPASFQASASPAASHPAIDPEILPVFLEDAHQAMVQLEEALPAWTANLGDENAVALARRAFHTLKGSGRMVEAGEIAELAYDAETVLNKVRGRQLGANADVLTWMTHAYEAVRDWVAALEQGQALPYMAGTRVALQALAEGCESAEIERRIQALAPPFADARAADEHDFAAPAKASHAPEDAWEALANEVPPLETLSSDPVPADVLPETMALESDSPASMPTLFFESEAAGVSALSLPALTEDTLLSQIFVTETRDHLAVLQAAFRAGPELGVSAGLLRAAHTMQGSARSVGLTEMAEACAGIEHYFQTRELHQDLVGAEGIDLLAHLISATEAFLLAFEAGENDSRAFKTLSTRVESLAKGELLAEGPTWWQKNLESQEGLSDPHKSWADVVSAGLEPPSAASEARETAVVEDRAYDAFDLGATAVPTQAAAADGAAEDTIDPELRDIFRDEARDLLDNLENALIQWRSHRTVPDHLRSLKRVLHTLKGGARMCGALRMGDFAHATEELLRRVEEGACVCDDAFFALMDGVVEQLGDLYKAFISGQSLVETHRARALLAQMRGESVNWDAQPKEDAPEDVRNEPLPLAKTSSVSPIEPEEDLFRSEAASQVRVRTTLLDRLVNYAGEVSIARSRMEQQVFSLREHLGELNGNVKRFREQIRELEIQTESQIVFRAQVAQGEVVHDFDPLEFDRFSRLQQLSRGLTENLHDLVTLHGTLDSVASQAESVLQQQARVNTELQEGLMRTRMVSFATQAHRLRQIVRQTSRELNKRTELVLTGADVELDRHLLERMVGPFEHMIRNAIDHGLEARAERERLGKPPIGTITIQALHESGEIVIRISDDGAGLNIDRIRAKAIERNLVPTAVALTDEQVMQFILLPGFSTAAKVTHLSGRGVGMDVVHSEVKKLGGAITVDTKPGRGTTFVIRLPLTLSIAQALMVGCGDQLFAIPLAAIINIVEAPTSAIADAFLQSRPTLRYGGRDYAFMDLGARLGIGRAPNLPRKLPVLLLRLDAREVAVTVDSLYGTREVVVKPLGPQLSEIRGLFGATILGDGRVMLILDIPALWTEDEGLRVAPMVAEAPAAARPYVLVVDDSLTVRKVTTRFLQKQGFDAATAKDGVEALEQLRERVPDVMLVDIEMPRMDGYELTSRIREDVRLRHIPIIMITSRSGQKHREHAMSLGVDVYLGKPYQEDDLRKEIDGLMRRGHE